MPANQPLHLTAPRRALARHARRHRVYRPAGAEEKRTQSSGMRSAVAGITKLLGIAIADADAGRITHRQLLEIFQEAIDNGDILEERNEEYVVAAVFPLIDAGVLQPSIHVEALERRMNSVTQQWLQARADAGSRAQPEAEAGVNPGDDCIAGQHGRTHSAQLHRDS